MDGVGLNGRRRVQLLAAVLAGDAVFDVVAKEWVHDDLERLRVPQTVVPVVVSAKLAATLGLLLGLRHRRLGVLTSACLVVYFVLAIGAHIRVRDEAWRYAAAIAMLVGSARAYRVLRREAGV